MFIKPVTGRAVRCPVTGTLLPDAGANVPDNAFWQRRLRDADVVPVYTGDGSATAPILFQNQIINKAGK